MLKVEGMLSIGDAKHSESGTTAEEYLSHDKPIFFSYENEQPLVRGHVEVSQSVDTWSVRPINTVIIILGLT